MKVKAFTLYKKLEEGIIDIAILSANVIGWTMVPCMLSNVDIVCGKEMSCHR